MSSKETSDKIKKIKSDIELLIRNNHRVYETGVQNVDEPFASVEDFIHEFNNVMTAVTVNLSTARLGIPEDNESTLFLLEAQKASLQARNLVDYLPDLIKKESAKKAN